MKMADSDPAKMADAIRKLVSSLDKGVRLDSVMEEDGKWTVVLSKGNHTDKATLSPELLDDFLQTGKGGKEVRHALGKVISKINLLSQRRR
jgi:hypothetical protein